LIRKKEGFVVFIGGGVALGWFEGGVMWWNGCLRSRCQILRVQIPSKTW